MNLVLDRCSIVIVGAWNLAILRPEWVGRRMFPDEQEIEFGLELGNGGTVVTHVRTKSVGLAASPGKVELKPLSADDSSFVATEDSARALLAALPETPVVACGLNFGFETDRARLEAVLNLTDEAALRGASAKVSATRITRRVTLDTGAFTFTIDSEVSKGTLSLDFNHHFDVQTAPNAAQLLHGAMTTTRARSQRFLRDVYETPASGSAS